MDISFVFDKNGPFGLKEDFATNLVSEAIGIFVGTILLGVAVFLAQRVHSGLRDTKIRKAIGVAVWRNIVSITSHELVLDAEGIPRARQIYRDLQAIDSYLSVHLDLIPSRSLEDFLIFRSAVQQIAVELSQYVSGADGARHTIKKLMEQLEKQGSQRTGRKVPAPDGLLGPFLFRMFSRLAAVFGRPSEETLALYPTEGRLTLA
jgi:hypothetical protein